MKYCRIPGRGSTHWGHYFFVDSLGGGLVNTSIIALWFEVVFHITLSAVGIHGIRSLESGEITHQDIANAATVAIIGDGILVLQLFFLWSRHLPNISYRQEC